MSKYSDLRWKIADLEKELEKEKNYSHRLLTDLERYIYTIYEKDKIIDELKQALSKLSVKSEGE